MAAARPRIEFGCLSLLVAGSRIPGSRYKEVGCRGQTGVWYSREPLGRQVSRTNRGLVSSGAARKMEIVDEPGSGIPGSHLECGSRGRTGVLYSREPLGMLV